MTSPVQEKAPSKLSDLLKDAVFDVEKAVKTASFAFSVYGAPNISTWYYVQGGTRLGLPQETVRRNFNARLRVTVLRCKELPKEAAMADYVLSGSTPDAFVLLEVKSKWGYDQGRTPTVMDSYAPEWTDKAKATHDLLVEDLSTATLEITVRDENRLGKDTLIGNASLPPSLLPALHQSWTGWLPLTEEGKEGGRGHIEVVVQVLPAVGEGEGIELSESAAVVSAAAAVKAEEEAGNGAVDSDDDNDDDEAPKSTEAALDWHALAEKLTNTSLSLRKYRLAAFFSNDITDTQGGIWWRKATKELVLVFRGTEITSFTDVLTDMDIRQVPLDGTGDKRLVHTGFLTAFKSVVDAAYHCLDLAVGKDGDWAKDGWTIDCSGHSLGGALASLMAHSIGHKYPELCTTNRLHMYSFGAPRVGNPAFCEEFNMLLGHALFRIVNKADVVPRMPGRKNPGSIEYDHFGFCVLITDEALKSVSIYLDGEANLVDPTAPPPPSSLPPSAEALSNLVEGGVPVSVATAAVDEGKEDGDKTTMNDMLDVASSNIKTLGGFLQAEPVGAYERADQGMDALPVPIRRGSIPVNLGGVPEVVMGESLFNSDVRDHTESSYFEAIQKFAALMVEQKKHEREHAT